MPPRVPLWRIPRLPTPRHNHQHFGIPRQSVRYYSAEAPLITVTDVDAPGSGYIRVLELNRPAARNAISRALLSALRQEVDDVHAQYDADGNEIPSATRRGPTRALVLASALDTSFCAGADLKERKGFTQEEYVPVRQCFPACASYMITTRPANTSSSVPSPFYRTAAFLANLRSTFTALSALPVPTISAISSLALGGGLELALSTTFRVLTSNAAVGLPETRLGIIPGAGGTFRLPALIGMPRARDLVLTGRRVSAAEAYFFGIADRLVEVLPDSDEDAVASKNKEEALPARARRTALAEAVRLAMEICEGGPVAIRAGLQAVSYAREEVEDAMYQRVVATEDRDEALKAFGEKRKPVFKGR